jgi:hypothetical protein
VYLRVVNRRHRGLALAEAYEVAALEELNRIS